MKRLVIILTFVLATTLPLFSAKADEDSRWKPSIQRACTVTRGKTKVAFKVHYHLYYKNGDHHNGPLSRKQQQFIDDSFQKVFDRYSIDRIRDRPFKTEIINWQVQTLLGKQNIFYRVRFTDISEILKI